MFIELIDLLRCPREHEDSWLVAAFSKMDGRFVVEGRLGCPVCSASYSIVGGVGEFAPRRERLSPLAERAEAADTLRIAAMLNLARPGSVVVLEGDSSRHASALVKMTEARVVVMNASSPVPEAERVAAITGANRIPVAARSVDGIVIESGDEDSLHEALRVLVAGGRIVAPADTHLGNFFREIARDDRNVVGETIGQLVTLGRTAGR